MIGIILAAGAGNRLQNDINMQIIGPKCLIKINKYTLFERQIGDFKKANLEKVIVVSGFKEKLLSHEVKKMAKKYSMEIETVHNDLFSITNTAYSLDLALQQVNESDVVILNGDVIFENNILTDIVTTSKNAMVIDNLKELTQESFKVMIANGKISSIGKNIPIETSTGEFIGLSKITKDTLSRSKKLLKKLISLNKMSYYDMIFKEISNEIDIEYIFTNGRKWTEIDDINDFKYAEKISPDIDINRMIE